MRLDSKRDTDPDFVEIDFVMEAADVAAAFDPDDQATHDLFYALYGPHWEQKPMSVRLNILSQAAARVEQRATSLNLSAAPAEPK